MANKYRDENEAIDKRFDRAARSGNTAEMYAAKNDYDENIKRQKEELSEMRQGSPEYQQKKGEIEKQEHRSRDMDTRAGKDFKYADQQVDKLDELKAENEQLADKMHSAARRGDGAAYDKYRQQYETNIKAQDGISKSLKDKGVQHENTTQRQNITKQHLDNDMADKYAEKMQKAEQKGKQPDARDKAQYEKYMKQTRNSEQENLKRMDDKKLEKMETYGVSQEEIQKERKEMEQQRERYR